MKFWLNGSTSENSSPPDYFISPTEVFEESKTTHGLPLLHTSLLYKITTSSTYWQKLAPCNLFFLLFETVCDVSLKFPDKKERGIENIFIKRSADKVCEHTWGTPFLPTTLYLPWLHFSKLLKSALLKPHAGNVLNAYPINLTFVFNTEVQIWVTIGSRDWQRLIKKRSNLQNDLSFAVSTNFPFTGNPNRRAHFLVP